MGSKPVAYLCSLGEKILDGGSGAEVNGMAKCQAAEKTDNASDSGKSVTGIVSIE